MHKAHITFYGLADSSNGRLLWDIGWYRSTIISYRPIALDLNMSSCVTCGEQLARDLCWVEQIMSSRFFHYMKIFLGVSKFICCHWSGNSRRKCIGQMLWVCERIWWGIRLWWGHVISFIEILSYLFNSSSFVRVKDSWIWLMLCVYRIQICAVYRSWGDRSFLDVGQPVVS